MLDTGEDAPEFTLPNQDGETISLSEFEGQRVVLYFYPRAHTSGCTIEAKEFRDAHDGFRELDAVVLGISNDAVDDLADFREKHDLPFDLLSDEDGAVARQYESYGTVEMVGEEHEIAFRNTYVIGPDGTIEAAFEGVDPSGHAEDVLAQL